jgi:transcriptional regulator with XRE-family HTH domain
MDSKRIYANNIKRFMLEEAQRRGRKFTQTDFAKLIPCTDALVSYFVNAQRLPSYRMAMRIQEITNGAVPASVAYPTQDEIVE